MRGSKRKPTIRVDTPAVKGARPLPASHHPDLRKPGLKPKPLELPSPSCDVQGFIIRDESRKRLNARAKISGSHVIVWSPEVKSPVAVRYAWANHPVCNLDNKDGLPAFPFRTDKFPMESGARVK